MDLVKPWLLLFVYLLAGPPPQAAEAIPWEADRKLSWEDFRGVPPNSKRVAATTASGISYSYQTGRNRGRYRLDYQVTAFFYPQKSWYHRELCDSVVLSHEQLHFDITEMYARRMRKELGGKTFGPDVKSKVRQIFKRLNRELSEFQARYDRETDFSRDREAQRRWNAEIARMLSESAQD